MASTSEGPLFICPMPDQKILEGTVFNDINTARRFVHTEREQGRDRLIFKVERVK